MERKEIQIGVVTYQLSRVFVGSKTATELMIDAVVDHAREESSVDGNKGTAV